MRILLDTNVWVAGIASRGLCHDLVRHAITLHEKERACLLVCTTVEREILRILTEKIALSPDGLRKATTILHRLEFVADGDWQTPSDFPDPDDVPIIGAALGAGADLFVTGDKALLALSEFEGLPIRSPRDAYIALRGL